MPGKPAEAVMANVEVFVNKYRRVALQEVIISSALVKHWHIKFYTKISMSKVNARWVLKQQTKGHPG